MGVIIFNGQSTKDLNIVVEQPPSYQMPEKDYDVTHIPGRNGDIVIDNGSYQNVTRSYEIAIGELDGDFATMANSISEWLHSASGYVRLEDSYEPSYYRLAYYSDSVEVENILSNAGKCTIDFNCKPQRFLKTGDTKTTFTSAGTITNPTIFTSLPIINVKGSGKGVLRVGEYVVTISSISTSVTIDSEIQDAYKGTENKNSTITLDKGFPKLVKGNNSISFTGGITSVEVIPKWWTL